MGESESFLTKVQPGTAETRLFPIKRQKEIIAHMIGQIILLSAPSRGACIAEPMLEPLASLTFYPRECTALLT